MKRWDFNSMLEIGSKLFKKIHKRKYLSHPNHEIHFMAREIDDWLPEGIQSLIEGDYCPRFLKRIYFQDAVVDQLHLSDRILQHIILKQIKPTFRHIMNKSCHHLCGPRGVRIATQRIRQVLQDEKPKYLIRADIKSFYSSILHHKLLQDIKNVYDDPCLIKILTEIIKNPIETPRGCRNPVTGIALRGPLSQFFSALYLKPLDDAFLKNNVTYLRYQDDLLILCKSERQLKRCKRIMMNVLQERGLTLSRKKTRIGRIDEGFHFLGVNYSRTQLLNNTHMTHSCQDNAECNSNDLFSGNTNQEQSACHQENGFSIVPHARTLRKAREQITIMVADGHFTQQIRDYLRLWCMWWVQSSEIWDYKTLLKWFFHACWENNPAKNYAAGLLMLLIKEIKITQSEQPFSPHQARDNQTVL